MFILYLRCKNEKSNFTNFSYNKLLKSTEIFDTHCFWYISLYFIGKSFWKKQNISETLFYIYICRCILILLSVQLSNFW